MTTATDRQIGLNGFTAWKPPVQASTTANIELSGTQTIDGVALVSGDRVLVQDQTDATENGIYVVNSAAWTRSTDFNGARDVVQGTSVLVLSGSTNGLKSFLLNTANPTIGTDALEFAELPTSVAQSLNFSARNAGNAALLAAQPDGTIGWMAGVAYEVDSTATGTDSCTNDLSVDGLIPAPSEAGVDARCFGVLGDSASTYDTEFAAALAYVKSQRTSPATQTNYGQGVLRLPKGRIRLLNTVANSSLLSLRIRGQGRDSTAIEFENDTDPLFDFQTYDGLTFEGMSLIHVDQGAGFGAWTNKCFSLDGTGGGQKFQLIDSRVKNFGYAVYDEDVINGDHVLVDRCEIQDAQTVFYGRNSQGLNVFFTRCQIYGKTTRVFDIAGHGNTVLEKSDIIVDGAWFYLASVAGKYGRGSVYTIRDCKGEFLNEAGHAGGSRTAILDVDDSSQLVSGQVNIENSVLDGGSATPDPAYPQIRTRPSVNVYISGGAIKNNCTIELTGGTTTDSADAAQLRFENMIAAPPPSNVSVDNTAGSGYPAVVWKDVKDQPNLTMVRVGGPGVVDSRAVNALANGVNGYLYSGGATTVTDLTLDFDGARQALREIALVTGNKQGGTVTVKAYQETAKTNQIGSTLTLAAANGATAIEKMSGVDGYIGTEVTVEVTVGTTGTPMRGHILVRSDAVPMST